MAEKEKNERGEINNVAGVQGATLSVVPVGDTDQKKTRGRKPKKTAEVHENDRGSDYNPPVRESYGVVGPNVPKQARAEDPKPAQQDDGKIVVRIYLDTGHEVRKVGSMAEAQALAEKVCQEGIWKDSGNKRIKYPPHKISRVEIK